MGSIGRCVTGGGSVLGRALRGDVGVVGAFIRFGRGLSGRTDTVRLIGPLRPGLGPALGGQGVHLGLLGGHGHRLEQLGERIGSTRRGEGPRRNGGAAVVGALGLWRTHGLGGHDHLDGAGDRAHVLGLLSGVNGP